jgi:steroid delta-isomerase-like uncharacterized protein
MDVLPIVPKKHFQRRNFPMANVSDIQRQVFDVWNRRDWDTYRTLLHSEYRYIGPDGKELIGPEAGITVAKMYANAFPDGKLEVKNSLSLQNISVSEIVARGTHKGDLKGIPPTNKPVEVKIANIMEFRDGKIYREREYFDMMTMLAQIGVVKPPAHTAA